MRDFLADFWARVELQWHVVAVAFIAALPGLLDWLGVIDLKPILVHVVSEPVADAIVGALPFALVFLKPMLVVAPAAPEEDE